MLIPVFLQNSYPNPPNQRHLRKLPYNLVPAPWPLRCELPILFNGFFSDLTAIAVYCRGGFIRSSCFSKVDSLYVADPSLPTDFGSPYGTDGPPPVTGLVGCYLIDNSKIVFFHFLMLLVFELGGFFILGNPSCMMQTLLEQLLSP